MEKRDLAQELLRMRAGMQTSASDDGARERELLRFAEENLNASQQEKLQSVLRDRQALETLLQSDSAKVLLERLRGGK